jgi:putative oxidoreductase
LQRGYTRNGCARKEILDRRNREKQPALMKSLNRFADPVYCIMRLIVGLMLTCHGAQKILGWFAKPGQPPAPLDTTMTIGGWIELICGLLIAIGLLTRPAAFLASGMMAVAYFMAHASGGFFPIVNRGELAVAYCWLFFFLFFYGPGRLSLDAVIWGDSAPATSTT